MSFPTKYLSSSPTVQRDYAILGNRLKRSTLETDPISEHEEEQSINASIINENGAQESIARSESEGDMDNMSNLSLPNGNGSEAYEVMRNTQKGNEEVKSSQQSSRRTSNSIKSPYMGASSTSFTDRSRGHISANLHQQIITSPIFGHRSGSVTGADAQQSHSVGGLASSLVLGGHHLLPPADADMRSQEELDYASTSSFSAIEPDDDDLTPMPGTRGGHRHVTGNLFGVHSNEDATENSPLLRETGTTNMYGSSNVELNHGNAAHARRPSWHMTSGWDLRQPAPPDQAQLNEIAHESDQNIHRRELAVLIRFSIPIWLCHLLELSLNVVSVFSLGHLGTNELAAASLSSMTANVVGYSVLAGFISALDSILPGAYTSQPKMVGLYTQRMLVIVTYLLVPISAIWLNAESILLLLGQDPIVADLAAQYLRVLVIGLPGYAGFEVCRRYLQAQGLMHAPTIVLFVASPINALLNWLFVWGPPSIRLGFIGAPLASIISMWLMFILGLLQCYIAPRIAWDGWSRLAFTGLKPIFQLGLAGTFAMCAEWWSWEIVGLVTSKLGTLALAAQSVLLVCSSITYQLPYAMSIAVAVRVGNLLGASQAQQAKICSDMAMLLSLVAGVANSLFYLSIRDRLGGLFSEDERVINLVSAILPVMAAFQVMDGVCGITSGILRGTGRQSKGAVINLTGYYVIGIPIGLVLTFGPPQWGLSGLWWGLTIALTYASIFTYLIIKRTDWDEEVRKTYERMTVDETSGAAKPNPESQVDLGRVA
ncbi:hypothetical protein L7F22_019049 [Adiantum nelumboides]|nr:hypothetical protein [Adiantum nelumboides]